MNVRKATRTCDNPCNKLFLSIIYLWPYVNICVLFSKLVSCKHLCGSVWYTAVMWIDDCAPNLCKLPVTLNSHERVTVVVSGMVVVVAAGVVVDVVTVEVEEDVRRVVEEEVGLVEAAVLRVVGIIVVGVEEGVVKVLEVEVLAVLPLGGST